MRAKPDSKHDNGWVTTQFLQLRPKAKTDTATKIMKPTDNFGRNATLGRNATILASQSSASKSSVAWCISLVVITSLDDVRSEEESRDIQGYMGTVAGSPRCSERATDRTVRTCSCLRIKNCKTVDGSAASYGVTGCLIPDTFFYCRFPSQP